MKFSEARPRRRRRPAPSLARSECAQSKDEGSTGMPSTEASFRIARRRRRQWSGGRKIVAEEEEEERSRERRRKIRAR